MTNQAYPSYNGYAPSWADIAATFTVDGGDLLDMTAFAGIKCGRKVEVGEQRGASGGRVTKRTRGSQSVEASASLYREAFRQLLKSLAKKGETRGNQVAISTVTFDILIQHTPPGETEIYQRKLKGCRYLGEDDDMKEGNDADVLEIQLNPLEIVDIIDGQEITLI